LSEDDKDNLDEFDVTFTGIKELPKPEKSDEASPTVESNSDNFALDDADDLSQVDIPGEELLEELDQEEHFDDLGDLEETKANIKAPSSKDDVTNIMSLDSDFNEDEDETPSGLVDSGLPSDEELPDMSLTSPHIDAPDLPDPIPSENIAESHSLDDQLDANLSDSSDDEAAPALIDDLGLSEEEKDLSAEEVSELESPELTNTFENNADGPELESESASEVSVSEAQELDLSSDLSSEDSQLESPSDSIAVETTSAAENETELNQNSNSDLSLNAVGLSATDTSATLGTEATREATSFDLEDQTVVTSSDSAHSIDGLETEQDSLSSADATSQIDTKTAIDAGLLRQMSTDESEADEKLEKTPAPTPSTPPPLPSDEAPTTVMDTSNLESGFDGEELMKHHVSEAENAPQRVRPAGGRSTLMEGSVSKTAIPNVNFDPVSDEDSHKETFDELRQYGKNLSPSGNLKTPVPFSILITGIKYIEDAEKILSTLRSKSLNIDLSSIEAQAKRGKVLIPRISEYAAMYFARSLRSIDANLIVGPSDEIFSSKDSDELATSELVSKLTLEQNKSEGINFQDLPKSQVDVILTTSANVPGETISQFQGVVSSSKAVPLDMSLEQAIDAYSEEVLENIRRKTLDKKANAVVGVQISIQNFNELGDAGETTSNYQVVASGTAVKLAIGNA
jgi:uncharacterized protein YbjQ (UPF0145 family)